MTGHESGHTLVCAATKQLHAIEALEAAIRRGEWSNGRVKIARTLIEHMREDRDGLETLAHFAATTDNGGRL